MKVIHRSAYRGARLACGAARRLAEFLPIVLYFSF